MLLELKDGIIYGPVRSRRLGRSLGVNLLPRRHKLCTFDCLYCQYGWSNHELIRSTTPEDFPTVDLVLSAVARALDELTEPPAFITFSGNGEPTLHPRFANIVEGVTELRDRYSPSARTTVLSNSSRVNEVEVRRGLERLDLRIMKMDAGNGAVLRRFSRPVEQMRHADLVEGLRSLPDITVQALFAGGPAGNTGPDHLRAWVEAVATIAPTSVQLYTLARGYPSREIEPTSPQTLTAIRDRLSARNIPAQVF